MPYGPCRPPIRATATSRRRRTRTTEATAGSGQTLNLATVAAGEVTSGEAVKYTDAVGVTIKPICEPNVVVTFDLSGSARYAQTTRHASSANPMGPVMPRARAPGKRVVRS